MSSTINFVVNTESKAFIEFEKQVIAPLASKTSRNLFDYYFACLWIAENIDKPLPAEDSEDYVNWLIFDTYRTEIQNDIALQHECRDNTDLAYERAVYCFLRNNKLEKEVRSREFFEGRRSLARGSYITIRVVDIKGSNILKKTFTYE